MRSIIIEDESDAQNLLKSILNEYCPEITIVGIASNLSEGRKLFELQPDIVFLDIQLGSDLGFQLLDEVAGSQFKIIVTSAYEKYAMEAFKYGAISYVLKPYSPNAVMKAVKRIEKFYQASAIFKKLDSMVVQKPSLSKLSLPTLEGYEILDIGDIVSIEANRSYSIVHLEDKKRLCISKALVDIENMLSSNSFFRTHLSHLINLGKLMRFNKEDGGYAVMSNGLNVPVSRRKKGEFLALLKTNTIGVA